ncbi:thiolase C-terminal domain-containing protein [Gordonia rubripertincta]|uniref:Acetyl-CoA acetyltransferase n=1 Tax=Gordonia rubripertincta TaxID=36822 RepID=A0ABT4MSC3_GORRU|nr:acetyl-CoA acetyltransferase [Gordonia rubripertincta]MCZ4548632.1 acetyl-CoA acetyltransferase [Gordonia rubripertincta]
MQSFSGLTAISGIGMTEISRDSGTDPLNLALRASREAIADADLSPGDIDGVLSYHLNDSCPVNQVAERLDLDPGIWTNEIFGGGTQSASILGDAAMLIESGTASNVLVFRALNGRSGKRMGQAALSMAGGEQQFTLPYGMAGPVNLFALSTTRWMHESGATTDDLAAVVMQSRELAADNERALIRTRLTREEYDKSPMIASPLRRVDCCQETDAAAALVVSRTDNCPQARIGPRIRAAVRGGGRGASAIDKAPSVSTLFTHHLREKLWATAGVIPSDVDVAMIYDAYSPVVLQQLEDLGFCEPGGSGSMFRAGRTLPSGDLPVNPSGGLLSEGYVHGLNNVLEAVRQLRGTAGVNQVPSPSIALCTGFGGSYGSALVLERS